MTSRVYYKGHAFKGILIEEYNGDLDKSDTFTCWLSDYDDYDEELEGDDPHFERQGAEFAGIDFMDRMGTRKEWVYNINEEWKHPLVDRMCSEISVDKIEEIIGEVGIRKVMKLYNNSDYQHNIPDLSTDLGLRQVFYVLLDEVIGINDKFYEEITKKEYDEWVAEHIEPEEPEEDEEEDDEDEDALWEANLAKGDIYSRLMKQAMELYPNDREACINYISAKTCGTFNGLVSN